MLSMLLAIATAQEPAPAAFRPVSVSDPARAHVRILRAAEIRGDKLEATEESVLRHTSLRERDGTIRGASLVEFY